MATRLKTVEYWFPLLTPVADNTLTAATQITVHIPEAAAGVVTFRTVFVDLVIADANTAAANVTNRNIQLTIQGASASTVSNGQTYTTSGEQFIFQHSADFTGYFTSNWGSNASRTLDCSVLVNTGVLGCTNASIKVVITYAFDDTQPTHVKTVWIPLNAVLIALATSKPGSPISTIPALDTYLPEAGKTIVQTTIVTQGNTEAANATDKSLSLELGTSGVITSGLFESGFISDCWYRLNQVVTFNTSTAHDFFMWASTADFDHPQNWLVVTYTFTVSGTSRIMNSLLLPMEFGGAMGATAAADFQRGRRSLWIEEPGTITTERVACMVFWDQLAPLTGLNARMGTGAYLAYTSVATMLCGGCGLMIRNDAAFTLARGRQDLTVDIYNTDTVDLGYNLAALWMVNYSSDVPSNGIWAANHTVIRNLRVVGTTAASAQSLIATVAPSIPETDYFITSVGIHYVYTSNTTGTAAGVHIGAENSTDGGWENVYESMGGTDPETGIRQALATARRVFNRWSGDPEAGRLDLQTERRWRVMLGGNCASFDHLDMYLTYHSITFTVSGTVTDSAGGVVDLSLHRESSGERIKVASRTGNGSYSFTWFDNTASVYVDAYENATHTGRSADAVATGTP